MRAQEQLADFPNAGSRVRVATEADAAPIAALTNAAFAIETFIEGMRTDAQRVAEMMRQGTFLVCAGATNSSSHPSTWRRAARAVISACWRSIRCTKENEPVRGWWEPRKTIAASADARQWTLPC